MASDSEKCLPQSSSSLPSKMDSQSLKRQRRLFLRAERRMRDVCPSPPPPLPESAEGDTIVATFSNGGAEIVVADPCQAIRLYAMGNFGTFVGQRMNIANWHCFMSASANGTSQEQMQDGTEPTEQQQQPLDAAGGGEGTSKRRAKESAAEWIARTTGGGGLLHLSPEEALYLSHDLGVLTLMARQNDHANVAECTADQFFANLYAFHPNFTSVVRRFIVYRYFRRLNWIVRDGISFGVDFLLYKCSVDAFHSSAGVRIVHSAAESIVTETSLGALQRELANCKKQLLLAHVVGVPESLQHLHVQQLEMVTDVQVLSMSLWSVNRSRISDLNGQELKEDG